MTRPATATDPAQDAWRTTGTSPTAAPALTLDAPPRSGPTIHLLGAGAVGRELLRLLATVRRRLVAVSDSTATLHDPRGIDPLAVMAWKVAGRPLREHPFGRPGRATHHIATIGADVLVDATSTDLDRDGWTAALTDALARGAAVAAAAKAALCEAGPEWLAGAYRPRVGLNAVLGGTGRAFAAELPDLQQRARSIAIVGNASTTAILEAIERGASLQDGIAEAQRLGYLEPDPELDLRGTDAAVKLAITAGAVTARRIDPRAIACEDIRTVNPIVVRERARRGATTRLVARLHTDGTQSVRYEEVSRDSLLAAPCGRVVYEYRLTRDERRIHIGTGLGAAATAAALFVDVSALAASAGAGVAGGSR